MESDREWVRMFGVKLRETFEQLPVEFEKLQEIRLRAGSRFISGTETGNIR